MSRGIQKVRRSIKKRKKIRENEELSSMKNPLPYIATDEEKHGLEAPFYYATMGKGKKQNVREHSYLWKFSASFMLFLGCTFLLQTNITPLEKPQQWLRNSFQEEFPFATVNEWYVSTLGAPWSLTPQNSKDQPLDSSSHTLPVIGSVVETFSSNGTGIMISPTEKSVIAAMNRGVVVFAGNDSKTLKTVVIQHADRSKSIYGLLSSIDVHLYQVVNTNQTIGTFQPTNENEMVYFAIEKNNEYIDPSMVIPVDEIP